MSVVQMRSVTVERGQRTILANIDWRVMPDEHWVVLGANGSGKTTLLTLLTGYEWPTSGHIAVFGEPYGAVDLRELRKRIGWVSHPLSDWMTRSHGQTAVADLVASGRLAMVGRGPLGADPFATLSQGEKTRVLLARAWMADLALLILDEPCAGLDIKGREQLLNLVDDYLQNRGQPVPLIYVTHHAEEILPGFTHVLLLKDGRAVAQGPRAEMLRDTLISEIFDVPVHVHNQGGRPWIEVDTQTDEK
jgi:iron complex transport system ATP-binding protein